MIRTPEVSDIHREELQLRTYKQCNSYEGFNIELVKLASRGFTHDSDCKGVDLHLLPGLQFRIFLQLISNQR